MTYLCEEYDFNENMNNNSASDVNFDLINNVLNQIKYQLETSTYNHVYQKIDETKEEKVVRLLKGDFERLCGISFDDFLITYHHIVKNNPEKLI